MPVKPEKWDLGDHHKRVLSRLLKHYPFTLRITEWKDYPAPVLVVKAKRASAPEDLNSRKESDPLKGKSSEVGFMAGETQRACLPILRQIVERVCDSRGVPLELQRYLNIEGLRMRLGLPLDEEAGAKLGLMFRLQMRVHELDRVELIARRVSRFTCEEASYWLSRTTHFGPDANRWALSGLRIMLGGQPRDPGVPRMLERLRSGV